MHTFENAVDKLAHLSQPEIQVDARPNPNFAAHFWINGPHAASVTSFLSADKIRFLKASRLQGTLSTNVNYLVYLEPGKLVTEQNFDSFIATAEAIVVTLS